MSRLILHTYHYVRASQALTFSTSSVPGSEEQLRERMFAIPGGREPQPWLYNLYDDHRQLSRPQFFIHKVWFSNTPLTRVILSIFTNWSSQGRNPLKAKTL